MGNIYGEVEVEYLSRYLSFRYFKCDESKVNPIRITRITNIHLVLEVGGEGRD